MKKKPNTVSELRRALTVEVRNNKTLKKLSELMFLRQEEDRRAISRELHDHVAQNLTGINFELAILSKEASKSEKRLRDKIQDTQLLVERSVEEVHRFAQELRPLILDDLGLLPALKSYLKNFSNRTTITTSLIVKTGIGILDDNEKTVLFRVAQEALVNVAKHSKATSVKVTLSTNAHFVKIAIVDNGVGFNVKKLSDFVKKKHIGLLGMQERVKIVGGEIQIKSSAKNGTSIVATVPVREGES